MGIILLLPLVYTLETSTALVMLCGLFCGSMFGGSVSAILLRTPGTPSASATVLDGYPLAQKGFAGKAIGTAALGSFWGGIISTACLIFIAPQLAKVALKFHSADYFALALFGLTIMASSSGKNMIKGLMSGAFGLLVSTVGTDPLAGSSRFTFGIGKLMIGFPQLAVLIGVFAVSEVLTQVQGKGARAEVREQSVKKSGRRWVKCVGSPKRQRWERCSACSSGSSRARAGLLPASWRTTWRRSFRAIRNGLENGSLEGIAAPEAANNGTTGGALIPMLTLGIRATR